jgi:metallo-beta-lactamase family protein
MQIRFIGALGTVTGSCTLLSHRKRYYLVDCGIEQGNHAPTQLDFKPEVLSAIFLTHAHLDHCGSLPLMAKQGFCGKIYCTRATADLTKLALKDAANLPNAKFDATDVGKLEFVSLDERPNFEYGKFFGIDHNLTVSMIRTSHVLGSVGFEFQFSDVGENNPNLRKTIVFSGDIGVNSNGNCYQPTLNDRQYPSTHAEFIVCESTYGGRVRDPEYTDYGRRLQALKTELLRAAQAGPGATVIFPCFTLQRLHDLVIDLHCLLEHHLDEESLSRICCSDHGVLDIRPAIVIDSPLALKHGEIFVRELQRIRTNGKPLYLNPELIGRLHISLEDLAEFLAAIFGQRRGRQVGNHYALHHGMPSPAVKSGLRIILAGSGMCNGGRIMHHLKQNLPDKRTTVVMTGFQGPGTPGSELQKRAKDPNANIDGKAWNLKSDCIKAKVVDLSGYFSGHADRDGLLDFIMHKNSGHEYRTLRRVFLVHGDNSARNALKNSIVEKAKLNSLDSRLVEQVELPDVGGGWFDLIKNKMGTDFDPQIDSPQKAALISFRHLEKMDGPLLELSYGNRDAKLLDEIVKQLELAKYYLTSTRMSLR